MNLANYSISPIFFANFHNFQHIRYANGLQFTKVFPQNFLQSLFVKLFYHQSFLLHGSFLQLFSKIHKYIALVLRLYCSSPSLVVILKFLVKKSYVHKTK